MAVPFFKVYYTPPGGTETQLDITQFLNQRGLDLKSGRMEFTVNNTQFRDKSGGNSVFVEDGLVEVYADYSPITKSSSQLLFSGQIRELQPQYGESGSTYKVVCADRTVLLLGRLWPKSYNNMKVDDIIRNVIQHNGDNTITTNNVVSTTTSGSAFPTLTNFTMIYKPVYEWITELSQTGYTGQDRTMIFYVDKDNDLHWFYPSQTEDDTIVEGVDNIYGMSFNRNADAMINMVIFNAGMDLRGNGTLWYYLDPSSRSNQLRMKYQPMIDISRDLFIDEIKAGNLTESSSGTVPYAGKLYVPVASGTTTWGVAFSGLTEYNDAFRDRLKAKGEERSKKITERFGKLMWNGNITLKGTNDYTAGDLIRVTTNTCGLQAYLLRVQDVTHNIGVNGWTTSIVLKEDEQAVTATVVN